MRNLMITGGLGLIGTALNNSLLEAGVSSEIFDIGGKTSDDTYGDIRDIDALRDRMARCDGVVHLGAVSRVVSSEQDPPACWATNIEGTRNVLQAAAQVPAGRRPWVINASSREVYGHPATLPVAEDAPLKPVNVYGRSKAAAEALTIAARSAGVVTAIARFSNVYGTIEDHHDRVIPAFCRAAATGSTIHIEGAAHTFDFTWVDDVADGLFSLCRAVSAEAGAFPTVHFVSGRATTLGELAEIARSAGRAETKIVHHAPRTFDVSEFYGDPRRAEELLGWRALTTLEAGVERLVGAFQKLTSASAVA